MDETPLFSTIEFPTLQIDETWADRRPKSKRNFKNNKSQTKYQSIIKYNQTPVLM